MQSRSLTKDVFLSGLRKRLIILIIVTIFPSIVLIIFNAFEQRKLAVQSAYERMATILNVLTLQHENYIDNTRQLLTALSRVPEASASGEVCNRFMQNVLNNQKSYTNIAVADLDGSVPCSAVKVPDGINISDRAYVKEAISTKNFSIGEYQIGRITGKPSINFGYPILDDSDNVAKVIFAALDLAWINNLALRAQLSDNSTFLVLDHKGIVLVRYPNPSEWMGKDVSSTPLGKKVLENTKPGFNSAQEEGLDGIPRLYEYAGLGSAEAYDAYIVVGTPVSEIYSKPNLILRDNLIGLAVLFAVVMLSVLVLSKYLIINYLKDREEVQKMKSDFVSLVSHQLKTPVAIIKGYVENMLSGLTGPFNDKQREYLVEIQKTSERNFRLISDLLNVSRLERGVVSVEIKVSNLRSLVELALLDYASKISEKGLKLNIEVPAELNVKADPDKLTEVIKNLLNNAIKFTERGEISIMASKKGEAVEIKISDTGKGMSQETLSKIFTTDQILSGSPTSDGGAGLGLFITKKFMNLQKGDIFAESQPGSGTTFYLILPSA